MYHNYINEFINTEYAGYIKVPVQMSGINRAI